MLFAWTNVLTIFSQFCLDQAIENIIEKYCKIIGLNDLGFELRKIYDGKQTGRVIVSIDD